MDASAKLLKKSMNLEVGVGGADSLKVAVELDAAACGRTGLADAVPDGGRKPRHGVRPGKLRAFDASHHPRN
jgi:hypothetical protein